MEKFGKIVTTKTQADALQYSNSIRPKCSADAPGFLSAVYKKGTQAKKTQADALQYNKDKQRSNCVTDTQLFLSDVYNKRYMSEKITSRCQQVGRSMIEMLGVLAIIGILTIGGAELVKKAYDAHDVNRVIDEISDFVPKIRRFARDYSSDENANISDKINTAKSFPGSLKYDGDDSNKKFIGQTDAEYEVYYNVSDNVLFYLVIDSLSTAACMEVTTADWGSKSTTGFVGLSVNNDTYNKIDTYISSGSTIDAATGIAGNTAHPAPMAIGTATNACSEKYNKISMAFR